MSEGSDLEKKYVCVCVCFHVHTHVWKRGLIGLNRSITNSSLIMEEMSENLATNVANRFSGGSLFATSVARFSDISSIMRDELVILLLRPINPPFQTCVCT